MMAIYCGSLSVLDVLFQANPDVNATDDEVRSLVNVLHLRIVSYTQLPTGLYSSDLCLPEGSAFKCVLSHKTWSRY